jgi:hypothetical protein
MNVSAGARVIRILGEEVQYRVFWTEVPVAQQDGSTKELKRPFIIARFNPETQEFEGHGKENSWECPFALFVKTLDEETAKKYYPKTRFVVNVYDRTAVLKNDQGFEYVDDETVGSEPHGKFLVLDQSAGKKGGKHFLQALITAGEQMRSNKNGKTIAITDGDLRIVTSGKDITTVRTVYPSFNQEPVVYVQTDLYDLWTYCQPWPFAAQQEILNGAEYTATREKYKLPAYPVRFSK